MPDAPRRFGLSRRAALSGAAMLGLGAGVDRALGARAAPTPPARAPAAIPFEGSHQAGIATPSQGHLQFAAFDVATGSRGALRDLLRRWSDAARALTSGRAYRATADSAQVGAPDPGEARGLGPARLTLTFGFGPSLFDRFGLGTRLPEALKPLPALAGDRLEAARSHGDLCVQACADDPQVAFHAIHVLFQVAGSDVALRWAQTGFAHEGHAPRNLLGFKDGTNNIRAHDATALDQFVWVPRADGPSWLSGGTYLVARRIQLVLESWDATSVSDQERTIGRGKLSGAPLGASGEHDAVDLSARTAAGQLVIPRYAHIRLASPQSNGGERILRRSYSYSSGATGGSRRRGGHQIDAGLFFIAFVRDPARQFVPLLRRLAAGDALTQFTIHTASAVFACPPGAGAGEYVGQTLLE